MKKILVLLVVMLGACVMVHAAKAGSSSVELVKLFDDERAVAWREDPLTATNEGVHDYDDRLPSVTPQDFARRMASDEDFRKRLHDIDRDALSKDEQVSYDLFEFVLVQRIQLGWHKEWRAPLNSDSGFYADVLLLADQHPFRDELDYERYIARLNEFPRYFRENIDNMRQGLRDGFSLPREILDGVSKIIAGAQIGRAEDATFWSPFQNFPVLISERDRNRLTLAGRKAIENSVKSAYADFQRFFEHEYRAHARVSIGASSLPGGSDYYRDLVRYYTTLPDATAEEIHEKGLIEVARIRKEMEAIVSEVGFRGGFKKFLKHLKTNPKYYPKTATQLLREAAWITREIDARMPDFFGRIPRAPYTVKAVPAALAPNYTAGRYNPGPVGAAGEYWVNITKLNQRPLYVMPALTLHEAAPGHHTQGSLARELENVPAFRRNLYPHAFGEGWGLYAEWLGQEMGVYHTPYQRFGRLTYEMWRACRLVVDTGIHALGWSRKQAVDFMAANTALSDHEIHTEVDRYVAWPGQALAYKTGEMKIIELRRKAEQALGPRFDIRKFHDAVLGSGGVTLPVLEAQIEVYIAQAQNAQ